MTNDSGIHGVTNSFAAALWALDISMEFAVLSGSYINFYNTLLPSNESVLGPEPTFGPSSIYYGILFAAYALRGQPTIALTTITAGTSSNVKMYGLNNYGGNYRVLIINKDTNPNISGTVDIKLPFTEGIRCVYLSAPTLDETANITFGNLSFVSNSTNYVG